MTQLQEATAACPSDAKASVRTSRRALLAAASLFASMPGCSDNSPPTTAGMTTTSAPTANSSSGGGIGTAGGSAGMPGLTLVTPPDGSPTMREPPNSLPLGKAELSGTVWAPGNRPGLVPMGQEIPISGAFVQVTPAPTVHFSEGVQCEVCVPPEGRNVLSDAKGRFKLPQLPTGTYWLSIRKGQFAKQTQVTIADGESRVLDTALTTLPSIHSPANGEWVPRMAVATGSYDGIEQVLGKMGMGGVNLKGEWRGGGPGAERIDIYDNGGETYKKSQGSIAELVGDLQRMRQYHLIFIPCTGQDTDVLHDPRVLNNLRQYVSEGGKLYTTDWSGSWHDNVFPQQVRFTPDLDTPATAYDLATNTWNLNQLKTTDGDDDHNSSDAEAVDLPLRAWLDGQLAPRDSRGMLTTIQADRMFITGSWVTIEAVENTPVGVDASGVPLTDIPKVFVRGGSDKKGGAKTPMTVTYQPAGCGRVLYSTYHTSEEPHQGLTPQERILLYLIMELTVCRQEPIPLPPVPR